MGIYALKLAGREKRVLVKADSQAKAKDRVVSAVVLSGEEMAEALEGGETVWRDGEDFPADESAVEGDDGDSKGADA